MIGRRLIQLMMTGALVAALAGPASAGGAEVTSGEFTTLPGGTALGYEITGQVVMRRVPGEGGKTLVTVQVRGLDPSTTYPVHVHNAPCAATPAGGGHYQHVVGGAVDAVNEMWPGFTTDAAGNGHGKATHANWAGPEAMSVVIHYPPMTSTRLACADLS